MNNRISTKLRIGGWVYHPKTLVVRYRKGAKTQFEVDLGRCTTSAEMLDWIIYVKKRSWSDRGCVEDLVAILDRLLDTQATLCSWGKEKGPLPKGSALRKLILNNIKKWNVVDRWNEGLKAKHRTDPFIMPRPEDWKELERMEVEAGLKGVNAIISGGV